MKIYAIVGNSKAAWGPDDIVGTFSSHEIAESYLLEDGFKKNADGYYEPIDSIRAIRSLYSFISIEETELDVYTKGWG
jgi:hypothetical protein